MERYVVLVLLFLLCSLVGPAAVLWQTKSRQKAYAAWISWLGWMGAMGGLVVLVALADWLH